MNLKGSPANKRRYGPVDGERFASSTPKCGKNEGGLVFCAGLNYNQGMDFLEVFYEECWQAPWMVAPENPHPPAKKSISTAFAFVVQPGLDDEGYSMLSKMILAIKKEADEVSIVEAGEAEIDELQMVGEPKKIIFFGHSGPATFGQLRNWYGHQVMGTHCVTRLQQSPGLKKETWNHLKRYAGLS